MRIIQARPGQCEAFRTGETARFFLLQAPGGSGKSAAACMLAAADLQNLPTQKQLILVPQTAIHKTFFGEGEEVQFDVCGQLLRWKVELNLCKGAKGSKGRLLKEFLLSHSSRTAIATHQAIVALWPKLTDAERNAAMSNMTFRIDEAHHLSGVFMEDDMASFPSSQRQAIEEESTKLGAFCRDILACKDEHTKLHLTTATFYRRNCQSILSESVRQAFVEYKLSWQEYFPSLGINDLIFDYFDYKVSPVSLVVDKIAAERSERHLVILPPNGKKYRTPNALPDFLTKLRRVCPADQVLDLVTKERQAEGKVQLIREPRLRRQLFLPSH